MVKKCGICNEPLEDKQKAVEILFGEWDESEGLIESPEKHLHYHEKCRKQKNQSQ